MEFLYKVVKPNDRSLFALGRYSYPFTNGTTVQCFDKTLGFFCFLTQVEAERYKNIAKDIFCGELKIKILKPLTEFKTILKSSEKCDEDYLDYFYNGFTFHIVDTVSGTVGCHRVYVVGDCQ